MRRKEGESAGGRGRGRRGAPGGRRSGAGLHQGIPARVPARDQRGAAGARRSRAHGLSPAYRRRPFAGTDRRDLRGQPVDRVGLDGGRARQIVEEAQRLLRDELHASAEDYESMSRLLVSQLDLSVSRLLRTVIVATVVKRRVQLIVECGPHTMLRWWGRREARAAFRFPGGRFCPGWLRAWSRRHRSRRPTGHPRHLPPSVEMLCEGAQALPLGLPGPRRGLWQPAVSLWAVPGSATAGTRSGQSQHAAAA